MDGAAVDQLQGFADVEVLSRRASRASFRAGTRRSREAKTRTAGGRRGGGRREADDRDAVPR